MFVPQDTAHGLINSNDEPLEYFVVHDHGAVARCHLAGNGQRRGSGLRRGRDGRSGGTVAASLSSRLSERFTDRRKPTEPTQPSPWIISDGASHAAPTTASIMSAAERCVDVLRIRTAVLL